MNEPKHVLAVLRRTIGLNQKEMAAVLECSDRTIQAVEYGKLKLSDKLAAKIVEQTGVSRKWLIAEDPSQPIMDDYLGGPYSAETFADRQAHLENPDWQNDRPQFIAFSVMVELQSLLSVFVSAVKNGKINLCYHKLNVAMRGLEKEFGSDADFFNSLNNLIKENKSGDHVAFNIELCDPAKAFDEFQATIETVIREKQVGKSNVRVRPVKSPKTPSPALP